MKAGRLKRRVTFQRSETHQGQAGEVIHSWVDIATVWAEIKTISGRELMKAGTVYADATVRIWTRFRDDITADNRILYPSPNTRGMVYGIVAVIPDADRTRLELLCKGGVIDE